MRRVTLACVALFAFGCDHSWSLDVDTLIAERATDNRVIATVTVGCHENGESCPATYCVGVEWFAADNRKLDSANSCPDAPMEGTVALGDGQQAVYAISSNAVLPTDAKLRVRAEVTVSTAAAKGDGNTRAKEIELPAN